ncbi:MAG: hypothetical protein J6D29_06735 [Solobacterium sp.]|nr:hypothetical protein [Solobacterium sp.]
MNCPNCGSENIQFKREKQGEVKGKKGQRVIYHTVALCKDCGNTWYVSEEGLETPKKRTWLWVLGWLFCFPIPLTILLLRNNSMKKTLKYIIIAVAWLLYLLIGFTGSSSESKTPATSTTQSNTTIETETAEPSSTEEVIESDNLAERYKSEIVVAAKMSLDEFIDKYDMSLAPERWTLAEFDDKGAVIGMTDITVNNTKGKYIYVGTLNINESGTVESATPHYIEVNGNVLGDDGYCKEIFDKIKALSGE